MLLGSGRRGSSSFKFGCPQQIQCSRTRFSYMGELCFGVDGFPN